MVDADGTAASRCQPQAAAIKRAAEAARRPADELRCPLSPGTIRNPCQPAAPAPRLRLHADGAGSRLVGPARRAGRNRAAHAHVTADASPAGWHQPATLRPSAARPAAPPGVLRPRSGDFRRDGRQNAAGGTLPPAPPKQPAHRLGHLVGAHGEGLGALASGAPPRDPAHRRRRHRQRPEWRPLHRDSRARHSSAGGQPGAVHRAVRRLAAGASRRGGAAARLFRPADRPERRVRAAAGVGGASRTAPLADG